MDKGLIMEGGGGLTLKRWEGGGEGTGNESGV